MMSYKLKLIKALSYSGIISATSNNPFVIVDNEDIAKKAVDTGYFELVSKTNGDIPYTLSDDDETSELDFDEISSMSISELKDFAAKHEIDLSGKNKKADILEAISVALGGSYTMIELQGK